MNFLRFKLPFSFDPKLLFAKASIDPMDLHTYRQDIEALRGLAVIAVIIFHLNQSWLPGGFTGVDIFFVISGYVVTASILRSPGSQGNRIREHLFGFYVRRIIRLMPTLLVCIAITTLLTAIFVFPGATAPMFSVAIRALIGWSNNYLIATSSDYFGLNSELNPFTHTWALGVEQQFYIFFPILLGLMYGFNIPLKPNARLRLKFQILIAICVTSMLFSYYLTIVSPVRAYYFMPSRLWEIFSGVILFVGLKNRFLILTLPNWILVLIQFGSVCCLIASFLLANPKFFPLPWAVLPVLGTILFIISGLHKTSALNRIVSNTSPLVFLGKISYSLYLWHWPIFTLFRWTSGLDSIITILLALAVVTLFSLASFYFVEQPIRLNFKSTSNVKIFLGTSISIVSVLTLVLALARPFKDLLYPGPKVDLTEWWQPDPHQPLVINTKVSAKCLFSNDQT